MPLPHDDGDQIGTVGRVFGVTRSEPEAFEPNRSHVVYFMTEPPLVLSAEPTDDGGVGKAA
jgi:hypothetical protein